MQCQACAAIANMPARPRTVAYRSRFCLHRTPRLRARACDAIPCRTRESKESLAPKLIRREHCEAGAAGEAARAETPGAPPSAFGCPGAARPAHHVATDLSARADGRAAQRASRCMRVLQLGRVSGRDAPQNTHSVPATVGRWWVRQTRRASRPRGAPRLSLTRLRDEGQIGGARHRLCGKGA
jgi:hypothetical protein